MEPGKVDHEFFAEHIEGKLGAARSDVLLGPTHGADFGVISLDDRVLALATDPLFVLRDLGIERAAWFAVHILLSDVALSGIPPTHLSIDINLPPETDPEIFAEIWRVFDREASDLGVNIITGHTGAYAGSAFPTIGGGTALSFGDRNSLVLPTGAEPGDRLLMTKGPAIETTGVLAIVFGEHLDLPEKVVESARERFWDASPVEDAIVASAAGPVTAMHDATEGGIQNAFLELARASEVHLAVESEKVPMADGVAEVCSAFGIDPWPASSEGTVVMSMAQGGSDDVLGALEGNDISAAVVGEVQAGEGVSVDGEPIEVPETDPFWSSYERGISTYRPG